MKLTMEIIGDEFLYSYEVGKSASHGKMPFCTDHLIWFSTCLNGCDKHSHFELQRKFNALEIKALKELNQPELREAEAKP